MANPPGPGLDESRTTLDSAADHVADHNTIHALLNGFTISDATDVDIVTTSPTNGQGLVWDGSKFVPGSVSAGGGVDTHGGLSGVTSDQHHAKSHQHNGTDGSGVVQHGNLQGIGPDDHHDQLHTIASHTGISGNVTGANLNTLTGGGNADALHTHTAAGTQDIDDLTDVDTTTTAPNVNDLLQWNGTNWVPVDLSVLAGSTALPTSLTAGVTEGHLQHTVKLHQLFNALLGISP